MLSRPILNNNLGLYSFRDSVIAPRGSLRPDSCNFRIENGDIWTDGLGWSRYGSFTLNGPVILVDELQQQDGTRNLIFGTPSDLYTYDVATSTLTFITPVYNTATVDVSAADPAVVTVNTGSPTWLSEANSGDKISFGATDEDDPSATWYEIDTVDNDTQLTLTTTVSGAPLTGTSYTLRQRFSGNYITRWSTDKFIDADPDDENLWLATNGLETSVKWNGTDKHATKMSGLGFICKHIAIFSNVVVYGNLVQSGDQLTTSIITSDVGQPEDVSSGLSEQFVVHGRVDEITNMVKLGDSLAIYSPDGIVLTDFVGDPFVLAFRRVVNDVGPISGAAVQSFGDYHEFVGPDGMYRFDGTAANRIMRHVWPSIVKELDNDRIDLLRPYWYKPKTEVLWAVPDRSDNQTSYDTGTITSPNEAYVTHYNEAVRRGFEEPVSCRDFPFLSVNTYVESESYTWTDATETWADITRLWSGATIGGRSEHVIGGAANGNVYTLFEDFQQDGSDPDALLHFPMAQIGDPFTRSLLKHIIPYIKQPDNIATNVTVTVEMFDHMTASPYASVANTFDVSLATEEAYNLDIWRRGRYFELKIKPTTESVQVLGYQFNYMPGGRK